MQPVACMLNGLERRTCSAHPCLTCVTRASPPCPTVTLLGGETSNRSQGAAFAEEPSATAEAEATTASTSSSTSSSSSSSSSIPSSTLQQFIDNEYELSYPSNYIYKETPIVRVERGPQPERSPVLARFEAPDEQPGAISIIMRRANSLKQTILQVDWVCVVGVVGVCGWGGRHTEGGLSVCIQQL